MRVERRPPVISDGARACVSAGGTKRRSAKAASLISSSKRQIAPVTAIRITKGRTIGPAKKCQRQTAR